MHVVLGLDAAWTRHHPSGVSIVVGAPGAWRCVAAYESTGFTGLLASAGTIAGAPVTLASVDMPLAVHPITARRACDNQVSRAFGSKGCGVHSPTPDRPGTLSTDLSNEAMAAGLSLAVHGAPVGGRQMLEVYPHIAVMRLLNAEYRVPYKIGRARQYWPDATPSERRCNILVNLARILQALEERVSDIPLHLPNRTAGPSVIKRFEDALDAVVCAWIGTLFIEGACQSYGDENAAIWVPRADFPPPTNV